MMLPFMTEAEMAKEQARLDRLENRRALFHLLQAIEDTEASSDEQHKLGRKCWLDELRD